MVMPFEDPSPFRDNTARDNWLANDISLETWNTESGRSILRSIRSAGIKIRDSTFFDLRRGVLGLQKHEEAIRRLTDNSLVPKAYMVTPEKAQISQQAQYRFSATAVDLTTGEETIIYRALATNDHLTKGQATEQISSLHLEPSATSNYRIENIELYQTWIQEGAILQ